MGKTVTGKEAEGEIGRGVGNMCCAQSYAYIS